MSGFSACGALALEERGEAPQREPQVALFEVRTAMAESEQLGPDLAGGDAQDAPPLPADAVEVLKEEPGDISREETRGRRAALRPP